MNFIFKTDPFAGAADLGTAGTLCGAVDHGAADFCHRGSPLPWPADVAALRRRGSWRCRARPAAPWILAPQGTYTASPRLPGAVATPVSSRSCPIPPPPVATAAAGPPAALVQALLHPPRAPPKGPHSSSTPKVRSIPRKFMS